MINRHTIFETLETLDKWTQLSCLGSMTYAITAEVINKTVRIIPDDPTPETLENFLNEERNIKLDETYNTTRADAATTAGNYMEQRDELRALLDLRQDFMDRSEELAADIDNQDERTLANTLTFMVGRTRIDPVQYARQYTNNARLGKKNYGQTRAAYVQQEIERAEESTARLIAKGELAVQFLEGLQPCEGPISEQTYEMLSKRCVSKLIARRIKIGQTLSWRSDPDKMAEAEADIQFIEEAIVALGGTVPAEAVVPPEAIDDETTVTQRLTKQFEAFQEWNKQYEDKERYGKSGPVTITRMQ